MQYDYSFLNQKYSKTLWQNLGTNRRAGIMCPLFSIHSENSVGVGEFPDLIPVIDWCKQTSHSILQLLPLNEAGYGNSPYSAYSSFAMDPVYLALNDIIGKKIDITNDLEKLQKHFPTSTRRVNYKIRKEKLLLLRKIYGTADLKIREYKNFQEENAYWLEDYSNYKLSKAAETNDFFKWLQWQAFEQMRKVALYARINNIKIMGDIPFLVSGDSADVFGRYKEIFNFDKIAGCPPDAYNAMGQKWGMPTYNWEKLKETKYQYFKDKLKYAENFFDMYRIDHVVGVFRLWTIDKNEPEENGGLNGKFDPFEEKTWKTNGENILKAMIDSSKMMPCAEDLGVIPHECTETLEELGITGLDVTRWLKDRTKEPREFIKPENFRKISCAVSSSHDMSNTAAMWVYEINTTDEWVFKKSCHEKGINFEEIAPKLFDLKNSKFGRLKWKKDITTEEIFLWNLGKPKETVHDLLDAFRETHGEDKLLLENPPQNIQEITYELLKYTSSAASIFCINSVLDLMLLEKNIDDIWDFRINFPGSVGDHNWSLRIPCKVEELANLSVNQKILELVRMSAR